VTARKLHDLDVFDGDVTEVSAVDSWPRRTNLEDLSGSTGHANEAC
jgi:DNA recombination protein RmuC